MQDYIFVKTCFLGKLGIKRIVFMDETIFKVDGPDNLLSWEQICVSKNRDMGVGNETSVIVNIYIISKCEFKISILLVKIYGIC